MKSKDFQNLVLSKYENGDEPTTIFRHLNGAISLRTIERWCKCIRDTGTITLSKSTGRQRTIRTKAAIKKIKHRWERRKSVSSRKLARELSISRRSVQRMLRDDLGLRAYKILMNHCSLMSIKKKESSLPIGYEQTSEKTTR